MIQQVYEKKEKQTIVRTILEALPEWFGISSAREEYIAESPLQTIFAAFDGKKPVGFLCLKETGKDTVELLVMGAERIPKTWNRESVVCRGKKMGRFQGIFLYAGENSGNGKVSGI